MGVLGGGRPIGPNFPARMGVDPVPTFSRHLISVSSLSVPAPRDAASAGPQTWPSLPDFSLDRAGGAGSNGFAVRTAEPPTTERETPAHGPTPRILPVPLPPRLPADDRHRGGRGRVPDDRAGLGPGARRGGRG